MRGNDRQPRLAGGPDSRYNRIALDRAGESRDLMPAADTGFRRYDKNWYGYRIKPAFAARRAAFQPTG